MTQLTYESLLTRIKEFEDKNKDKPVIIGMTFSPSAWRELKKRLPDLESDHSNIFGHVSKLNGIEIYECRKQPVESIAWMDRKAMKLFISADGSPATLLAILGDPLSKVSEEDNKL